METHFYVQKQNEVIKEKIPDEMYISEICNLMWTSLVQIL